MRTCFLSLCSWTHRFLNERCWEFNECDAYGDNIGWWVAHTHARTRTYAHTCMRGILELPYFRHILGPEIFILSPVP